MAEDYESAWTGEIYGGLYYDENRAGAYFAGSEQLNAGPTLIGEALLERYADYRFTGIGGHVLWPVAGIGDIGLVASQAWESYEFSPGEERDYQTRTVAIEWELELGRFVVAAQAGKYLKDYADEKPEYVSADVYFWGEQYDWYVRGATRRYADQSLNLVEVYHVLDMLGRRTTAYAGIGADDLSFTSLDKNDSVYAGAYVEMVATSQSILTLWAEAAAENDDVLFTIELNLAFGPGARTPYITAFGFSLDN